MDSTKFNGTNPVCNGIVTAERRRPVLPFIGNFHSPESSSVSYWDVPSSGSFDSAHAAGRAMALLLLRQCCTGAYRGSVSASMAPAAMIHSWSERLARETPESPEHVSLMRQMHGFAEVMTSFALVGAAVFGQCLDALSEDELVAGMYADLAMADCKVLQ
ncbi:hypothetical protein [Rhodocyclus tenuis]|uniref:Uncharacterized protein n=1 Tax=Rhodocyclus tenuis TaxID=1066 RepID=A0A840GAZ2_RHOTE|nr:hypothetical protein [Rhodocyclus tenuis]MBB4249035.1 hypothetical protein [Rhodocyclus tenuis]